MKKYNKNGRQEVKKSDFYRNKKKGKKGKDNPIVTILAVFAVIVFGVGWGIIHVFKKIFGRIISVVRKKVSVTDGKYVANDICEGVEGELLNDTPPIEDFDFDVKHRVLLEKKTKEYVIKYIRVKTVNKLVVNGKVYDEYKAVVEFKHGLLAVVNGCEIEAGLDSESFSYIKIDGKTVRSKERWI